MMKKKLTKSEEQACKDYETHKTRYSDSSFYDEVCLQCGCTDEQRDSNGTYLLNLPCPNQPTKIMVGGQTFKVLEKR